eukprot:10566167-Alexandrium_andersonii.AAC.1
MASASVAPVKSFSPCFHPTARMPAATTTTLASEIIQRSTLGGADGKNRAMGSVAPVGRKNNGS